MFFQAMPRNALSPFPMLYLCNVKNMSNPLKKRSMKEQKKNMWSVVIQAAIGILSAIATALGLQSCGLV